MLISGLIILLVLGLLRTAQQSNLMWKIAHDVHDHGPVPKLILILFCPLPIAFSTSLLLSIYKSPLFPWAGLVVYFFLAAVFGCLHVYFDRIGKPERQRQLAAILQQRGALQESLASTATAAPPLQDPRERFFFWLGVFVLPFFWSWFTLGRSFTRNQRVVAFSWLALAVCWFVFQWQALAEHLTLLSIGYPIVAGWVTLSLLAWLCYRLGMRPRLAELIMFCCGLGPLFGHTIDLFYRGVGTPFSATWLLPPIILALLHLSLEPVKRWAWGPRCLRGWANVPNKV